MFLVRRKACFHCVRPADPLQPRRNLGVIEIQVITAVRADKFERAAIAAFLPAFHQVSRLAPQAGRKPVTELPHSRSYAGFFVTHLDPPKAARFPELCRGLEQRATFAN